MSIKTGSPTESEHVMKVSSALTKATIDAMAEDRAITPIEALNGMLLFLANNIAVTSEQLGQPLDTILVDAMFMIRHNAREVAALLQFSREPKPENPKDIN